MTGRCSHCGEVRPVAELLLVRPIRTPLRTRLVCRPTVSEGLCFRSVGPRSIEVVEPADPDGARHVEGRPVPDARAEARPRWRPT